MLLLDDESRFARATEASLKAKFDQHLSEQPVYKAVKGEHLSFRIEHYAGVVTYNCSSECWKLDKKEKPLPSGRHFPAVQILPKTTGALMHTTQTSASSAAKQIFWKRTATRCPPWWTSCCATVPTI